MINGKGAYNVAYGNLWPGRGAGDLLDVDIHLLCTVAAAAVAIALGILT